MKHIPRMKYRIAVFLLCLAMLTAMLSAVKAEENEETIPDHGIPVVYLVINESQGTIDDMIHSTDHSVSCFGTLSVDVPEGFHYSDFPDLACESVEGLEMSIRGRGNSTWTKAPKKPFKIKLDKKTDLFGLGKNKHWVLVANYFDPTLIRDRIMAWLGDYMGFAFTPRGVPVDVVMTGENYGTKYLGSYYLSENVRVGENRIEIAELTEGDTEPDIITGGYLLQDAAQLRPGSPDRFITARGADWGTDTPSFDTEEDSVSGTNGEGEEAFAQRELEDAYENPVQQEYIQSYIQKFEDILFNGNADYRERMDIASAAKYWLAQEVSLNLDSFSTGSTYIYKDRDTADGISKIFWGPLWDFDYAWNHREGTSGFSCRHEWMQPLFYDRSEGGFVEELHKQWQVMREGLVRLSEDGGVIDQYYEETKVSADADHALIRPGTEFSYRDETNDLKEWIRRRIAWLDENFDLVDTMVHKVELIADGELYRNDFPEDGTRDDGLNDYPEKEGYTFMGWLDEEGNPVDPDAPITEDHTYTASYISDSEMTHAEDIAFPKNCDIIQYSMMLRTYQIPYTVIPTNADEKMIEWSSSDESLATVDSEGTVRYSGTGTVVLTGKLRNGVTREYTLTIVNGQLPYPASVYPDEEVIYMDPGNQSPFSISTVPSPAKIIEYVYSSEDESVVTVGENGVLTAAGPGEARVHVTASVHDEEGETVYLETYTTVIVSGGTPAIIAYTVTDDSASSWQKDSKDNIVITVKRSEADETCFSHFKDVRIDELLLEKEKDYTAVPGSTVITIRKETLETLSEGVHTVQVNFDDGSVQTEVTILAADQPDEDVPPDTAPVSPDTSDRSLAGWYILAAAALSVFSLALGIKIRAGH